MPAKSGLAILLLLAVSVGGVARTVNADSPVHVSVGSTPGAHVSVSPTPVPVGKSFTVTFWFEAGCCQWTGHETAEVAIWQSTPTNFLNAKIWGSARMKVVGGVQYEASPPGLSTVGTYVAEVGVWEPDGKPIATGFAHPSKWFKWLVGQPRQPPLQPRSISASGCPRSSVTVKQGEAATFQVLISYSDPSYSGTTINIQVSGLGPGMNYQVIPSPPTLRVSTSSSTPPGSYPITLTGSAKGVKHQANALLAVKALQAFDFSISASPAKQTIIPGASTTSTVTVGLLSGTSQNVALKVTGAPKGVSASLNPKSGTPKFSSILSITTTASAASGQYTLTITGNRGNNITPNHVHANGWAVTRLQNRREPPIPNIDPRRNNNIPGQRGRFERLQLPSHSVRVRITVRRQRSFHHHIRNPRLCFSAYSHASSERAPRTIHINSDRGWRWSKQSCQPRLEH